MASLILSQVNFVLLYKYTPLISWGYVQMSQHTVDRPDGVGTPDARAVTILLNVTDHTVEIGTYIRHQLWKHTLSQSFFALTARLQLDVALMSS